MQVCAPMDGLSKKSCPRSINSSYRECGFGRLVAHADEMLTHSHANEIKQLG
jgi:hypothetical protein